MANNCYFTMKLLGSKEALEELARRLDWQEPYRNDGIGRVFSFEAEAPQPSSAKNLYTMEGAGDCAWSIYSAMQAKGLSHRQTEARDDSEPLRALEGESARLHVAIEAYSSEPGVGFQEHVFIVDGEVLAEGCADYEEYYVADTDGDLESFNRENGTNFTEQDINHNGEITIGGYGEAFGDFRLLDLMAQEYESLRDMDALRKGEVEIAPQPDGTVGFFFADTSVVADVDLRGDSYVLNVQRGDQVAHGEWNDLLPIEQRLYGMEIAKHVPANKVREVLSHDHGQSIEDLAKEARGRAAEKAKERSQAKNSERPLATKENIHRSLEKGR